MGNTTYSFNAYQKEANPVPPVPLSTSTPSKEKRPQVTRDHPSRRLMLDPSNFNGPLHHSSSMALRLELSTQVKPLILCNQWVGLLHHHDQLQPYSGKDSQGTPLITVANEATHTEIIHEFGQGTRP